MFAIIILEIMICYFVSTLIIDMGATLIVHQKLIYQEALHFQVTGVETEKWT